MNNIVPNRAHRPAVLAVDDRPANLLALEALLEPLNVELFKATSGPEAIRLATERRFAVALIDVVMPGMDGFQTVRELRALPLANVTPIILLTAFEFDPRQIESLQGTALVDYIGKPLPAGLLRGKVEALVSLFRYREALAAKDRDIAMLAHDLQTPLASISAGMDLLFRAASDQRTQNVATRVMHTVQRMSRMVSDLTDYARAGQGPLPVRRQPVDLGPIVQQIADECRQLESADRIQVETSGDLRGEWDPAGLGQAITNVLVNAIRYGEGDVRVRVRRRRVRWSTSPSTIAANRFRRTVSPRFSSRFSVERRRARDSAWACSSCAKSSTRTAERWTSPHRPKRERHLIIRLPRHAT